SPKRTGGEKHGAELSLEGHAQTPLELPRRTQRVDAGAVSYTEGVVVSPVGSVDGAGTTRKYSGHGVGRQVEVSEVRHVVEANAGLNRNAFLDVVPPGDLQVHGTQPAEVHLSSRRWRHLLRSGSQGCQLCWGH